MIIAIRAIHQYRPQDSNLVEFANHNFALFLRDLFGVCNKGVIIAIIQEYITSLDPTNQSESVVRIKLAFFKIIFEHEHFIGLNTPIPINPKNINLANVEEVF